MSAEGPLPRSSRVRSSRASRARLSPFPPLRTPATQAKKKTKVKTTRRHRRFEEMSHKLGLVVSIEHVT